MNGRAYEERQQVTDVHGETRDVTDAEVAQAVAAAAKKTQETKPSIPSRLAKLAVNLRGMQEAYENAYRTWATAGSPLRSPNYDMRRAGKPGSRIPPEAEGRSRVFMVLAAQRLAMSLRVLAKHGWLASDAWHPWSVQQVIDGEYAWKGNGDPLWRDPDGDVTVQPPSITRGVSQLRGAVENRAEWDDEEAILDFLHEAEEAVNHVNRTGAWFRGMPAEETLLCSRDGCWNEPTGGLVCGSCRQKDYRDRKRQERGAA